MPLSFRSAARRLLAGGVMLALALPAAVASAAPVKIYAAGSLSG